jgi:hypothetical protein
LQQTMRTLKLVFKTNASPAPQVIYAPSPNARCIAYLNCRLNV